MIFIFKVNGDSSAADLDTNDFSGEDGIVRAIRNTQRLAEEVMNATGCVVSLGPEVE